MAPFAPVAVREASGAAVIRSGDRPISTSPRRQSRVATSVIAAVLLLVSAIHVPVAAANRLTSDPLTGTQPNIVVFLVDDLAALDDRILDRLPNIKQTFLDQGVRFTHYYGETPLCCPGRAGFLTGLHTNHHHVIRNQASLLDPSMTVATQLQGAGYDTMLVGKYLNNFGRIAGAGIPPGWDQFQAFVPGKTSYGGYYDYQVYPNGQTHPKNFGTAVNQYSTDVVRYRTILALKTVPADKPVFAWIAPYAPHLPILPAPRYLTDPRCDNLPLWDPPNYNEADVSDKPGWVRTIRSAWGHFYGPNGYDLTTTCRSMLAVDDMVGRVRKLLAAQGRLDKTLMVFASDNGMNLGAHRVPAKSAPYATQIPVFMSWPSVLGTEPRTIDETLSNIDLAPTLCELAGCTMGPYPDGQTGPDGKSFAGVLLGTQSTLDRDALLQQSPARNANLGMPKWYGLRTTPQSPLASVGCASAETGGCIWHYVEWETHEVELYDDSGGDCWLWSDGMPGDPCEMQNLASNPDYDSLRATLSARLAELLAENPPIEPPTAP